MRGLTFVHCTVSPGRTSSCDGAKAANWMLTAGGRRGAPPPGPARGGERRERAARDAPRASSRETR